MKKAKISLALVAGLVATIGLSSCNDVTKKAGVVLTYTDANSNTVEFTAEDLFAEYENASSASSTNFDKVYELLIRRYYDTVKKEELPQINIKAQNSVSDDMETAVKNAESGTSTYAAELEKILKNHGVETIDEDFEYWQYQHEKELFETAFYKDHLNELKDFGFTGGTAETNALNNSGFITTADTGYLNEKMPYHVRHILRKVSAASGELCQGKITATEATNLATVVTELASGVKFGEISTISEDGSKDLFGDLGKMDLDEGYVNEFKLGVYAYDTLYNKTTGRDAKKAKVAPVEDRTVIDAKGNTVTVKKYFEDKGIGTIPYGAAEALIAAADVDSSKLGYKINEDNEAFLPRNILFNKYFNKHNVCVITPNEIAYNKLSTANIEATSIAEYNDEGTANTTYAALPGFQNNTLEEIGVNALTDTEGHIVLVVRAGSSGSYEGVHFIVVERSALDEIQNGTTLSEYWTNEYPGSANFPKDTNGEEKTTYVNFFKQKTATYKERADKVTGWVKGYNTNISSYIFAWLVKANQIEFTDAEFGEKIKSYVNTKIEQSKATSEKSRSDTWRTYAEYLVHQDYLREQNKETGTGYLISETCAIGYLSEAAKNGTGLWAKGGACYGK